MCGPLQHEERAAWMPWSRGRPCPAQDLVDGVPRGKQSTGPCCPLLAG